MGKSHIYWDAENIQIHSHYSGAKNKFLTLVPGNPEWQRLEWSRAKKIAVYCECNEKRSNKYDNEVFNCIILDSNASQAADRRIIDLCKNLKSTDTLYIVSNDNLLVQECINVTKAQNIINFRTTVLNNEPDTQQNVRFKAIQFEKHSKRKSNGKCKTK